MDSSVLSIPASVIVLKRKRSTDSKNGKNYVLRPCCICSSNVTTTMTKSEFTLLTDLVLPVTQGQVTPPPASINSSRWICTPCSTSIEKLSDIKKLMRQLEAKLARIVQLLALKMRYSKSCTNSSKLELHVAVEEKDAKMCIEECDDDVKPIIIDFPDDCSSMKDFSSTVDLKEYPVETDEIISSVQVDDDENVCETNDSGEVDSEPLAPSCPSSPTPKIRRQRQSKIRAVQLIQAIGSECSESVLDGVSTETNDGIIRKTKVRKFLFGKSGKIRSRNVPKSGQSMSSQFKLKIQLATAKRKCLKRVRNKESKSKQKNRNKPIQINCEICDKKFVQVWGYHNHMRYTHGKSLKEAKPSTHVCDTCGKFFAEKSSLVSHKERVHMKLLKASCDLCDYKGYNAKSLNSHKQTVHRPGGPMYVKKRTYLCELCNEGYNFKKSLADHIKMTHDADKTLKCDRPGCRKTFYTQKNLDQHLEHFHPQDATIDKTVCPICSENFSNIRAKIDHIARAHKNKKEFPCHICKGVTFSTEKSLELHLSSHAGEEKRFLCGNCGQQFARDTALYLHMKIVCNPNEEEKEKFRKLRTEKQIAYRERARKKSFKCDHCGTLFLVKKRLDMHIGRFHKEDEEREGDESQSE
ncbi:zinc finger protein 652 isoform X2 [Folsomia candida]|uniref:zinc finger protein 652 isoform X2 n=1 Tax=Folsomia candida TaxID=158441 RepID=UPI0016050595|nr:zinc finger protein 652 isoform X2 [Folsomia candida]